MNNKKEYINATDEIKASESLKRKTMNSIKQKKEIKFPYKLANAMSFVLIILCVIFITDDTKLHDIVLPDEVAIQNKATLPTVDNIETLLNILAKNTKIDSVANDTLFEFMDATSTNRLEKSTTNVQVQGIDEADIVKTDGEYIYYIAGSKLVIVSAGEDMKIISEIEYYKQGEEYINPLEMYIDNNKLVMIVSKTERNSHLLIDVLYATGYKTEAIIYDITNKANPQIYRQFEIEGNYVTSRLKDHIIYLITDEHILYNETEVNEELLTQNYTDSSIGEERCILFEDIYYVPEVEDNSYLNITAFNTQTKREAEITTILGAGSNVYMSNDNIYVAKTSYMDEKTDIYKFSVNKTKVSYVAATEVSGRILNQFSMDEYEGNFRIATTQNNGGINSLYVLDSDLKELGKLENLAEGERIYSVRFMGEKGYIVTFKEVDPLFVIDLKNPEEPKILGELKIPGYSQYIHPYDETHIIGFGQSTNSDGTRTTGMKMALFDIADPTTPKELFSTEIGDSGTYSSILYNHKALLCLDDMNVFAFPITIHEGNEKNSLKFQGAIVYQIDLINGFTEKGRISHMELTNGYESYEYHKQVERIIYINNDLYTLSQALIKRTSMQTMQELNKVEIPVENN